MRMPVNSDSIPEGRQEGRGAIAAPQAGIPLSLESQLELRALFDYVESCRKALRDIEKDLSLLETYPGSSLYWKRAAERLESFCIESDSWGFDSLYEISLSLQLLLLESESRVRRADFWEALRRGLAVLSALLDQCENDFRRRLAIADTLDCINHAACR